MNFKATNRVLPAHTSDSRWKLSVLSPRALSPFQMVFPLLWLEYFRKKQLKKWSEFRLRLMCHAWEPLVRNVQQSSAIDIQLPAVIDDRCYWTLMPLFKINDIQWIDSFNYDRWMNQSNVDTDQLNYVAAALLRWRTELNGWLWINSIVGYKLKMINQI